MFTHVVLIILSLIFGYYMGVGDRRKFHFGKPVDLFAEDLKLNNKINDLLRDALLKGADKISVFQFHNGEKYYHSSRHVKFISKVTEKVSPGIQMDIEVQQNIPVLFYEEVLTPLYDRGEYLIDVIENMEECSFKEVSIKRGAQSIYLYSILSKDEGKMIGVLTVAYIKELHTIDTKENKYYLELANKISKFLH